MSADSEWYAFPPAESLGRQQETPAGFRWVWYEHSLKGTQTSRLLVKDGLSNAQIVSLYETDPPDNRAIDGFQNHVTRSSKIRILPD